MLFGKVLQAPGEALFKAKDILVILFGLILAVMNHAREGDKKTI
jgi:hypothetical protein